MQAGDEHFMTLALALARKGLGRTSPNPAVGAVVVRRGRVVGRGWHRRAGGPHAEVLALRDAGTRARGADLFVTLEPCCHHGRTPPCTDAILAAGIRRVVAAMLDPYPRVSGRGAALLRRQGVAVRIGCLRGESAALNAAYLKRLRTSLPFVTLKAAQSLDGRIAAPSGESRWISGGAARREAHALRRVVDAIGVGIETLLADDPRLTARPSRGAEPARVVFDARLRTPPGSQLLRTRGGEVIVVGGRGAPAARADRLRRAGARVVTVAPARGGGVALRPALRALAELGINHLLLEGGGRLATSFLAGGFVDRVVLTIAPILLGGERTLVRDLGVRSLGGALRLGSPSWRRHGGEITVSGTLAPPPARRRAAKGAR